MKNNLSTLSTLHYVYGAFVCVAGIALLTLVALGHFLNSDWIAANSDQAPPPVLGHLFAALGWVLFAFVEMKGVMNIISGRLIARRRGRVFSMITAGLDCLNLPLGMALGIYTFITLSKEEAKAEYAVA